METPPSFTHLPRTVPGIGSALYNMDFDPFGSLTDEKEPQLLSSNLNLVSNEAEISEEKMMTKTEKDADPVNDNIFTPVVTAQSVDFENYADELENGATSQQDDNYETSTDKIETTVWPADNEYQKSSEFKVKRVKLGWGLGVGLFNSFSIMMSKTYWWN